MNISVPFQRFIIRKGQFFVRKLKKRLPSFTVHFIGISRNLYPIMSVGGENLSGLIAKSACFCLNEDSGHPYSNLFVGDHTLFLQSDTDEQLIIHIGFNQTVSLKHIYLGLPADESCPATVKLFINQPSLGFSDASEIPPTQVLSLSPPSIPEVISHPLSAAKWQRVDSSKKPTYHLCSLFQLNAFTTHSFLSLQSLSSSRTIMVPLHRCYMH